MPLKIKKNSLKRLDAFRESPLKIGGEPKEIQITISINIALVEIKKTEEGDALLKTNFNLDMTDFGHIGAQIETIAAIDDLDTLIKNWEKSEEPRKLPDEIGGIFNNSIFYFIMPFVMLMAEKLAIPIPLPNLYSLPKTTEST